jgi:hypothetical protein
MDLVPVVTRMSAACGTVLKFGDLEVHTLKGQIGVLYKHLQDCSYAPAGAKAEAEGYLSKPKKTHASSAPSAETQALPRQSTTPPLPSVPPLPANFSSTTPPLVPTPIPSPSPSAFYGETVPRTMPTSLLSEFHADLCLLMVSGLVSWHAVDIPYWKHFFAKWVPGAILPNGDLLSGWILDGQVKKADAGTRERTMGRFGTGQCDGWKNVGKKSLITSMVNVKYQVC